MKNSFLLKRKVIFLVSLGLFSYHFSFLLNNISSYASPPMLGRQECLALYEHQLNLAQKAGISLSFALRLSQKQLQKKSLVVKQSKYCQNNVTLQEYKCQMKAKSLSKLLDCKERTKGKENAGESMQQAAQGSISISQKGIEEFNISPSHCQKSYHYILRLVSQDKKFQKRRDRQKLKAYWKSSQARTSFQKKCTKRFHKQDLKCIHEAKGMDTLAGCLLAIPE